jgi:integrase
MPGSPGTRDFGAWLGGKPPKGDLSPEEYKRQLGRTPEPSGRQRPHRWDSARGPHPRGASGRRAWRAARGRGRSGGDLVRHAHAVELVHEGMPLNVIRRQLGHTNLGVASIYLQGIDNAEIIATVHVRHAPMVPASTRLRL